MATSCTEDQSKGASSDGKSQVRGILKKSSSIDQDSLRSGRGAKEMKWDEMNILQTYHPADKDYGHQKITDPPTPYNHMSESDKSGDEDDPSIDPEKLADCLKKKPRAKILSTSGGSYEEEDDDEEEESLSEEAKAKKQEFRKRRKMHYDEFYAVKMRQQMVDDDDDEDEDVDNSSNFTKPNNLEETMDSNSMTSDISSTADIV